METGGNLSLIGWGLLLALLAACSSPMPVVTMNTPTAQAPTPTTAPVVGMPNPASVFCQQQGGKTEIRKGTDGEVGYCVFSDQSECEEWAFMRGECKPGVQAVTALRLTKADAGKQVALALGGILEIALESNPTTGYSWRVMASDEAILKQMGDPTFTPQSNLMGAPGVEVWKFQAVGAGKVTLKLGYKRWWDNAMQPNPIFEVIVNVGSAPVAQPTVPLTPAKRIAFAPGTISATVQSTTRAVDADHWVIAAMGGQTMYVNLTVPPGGRAALGIYGADGTVLISDHIGAMQWSGVLPKTQDYFVDVKSETGAVSYTLQVTIPPR